MHQRIRYVLLLICLSANSGFADDEQQRLVELNDAIAELQASMQSHRGEIAEIETELAENEKAISNNAVRLNRAEAELAIKQRELDDIQRQVADAQARKAHSEEELSQILNQIWRQRDRNGLAVLLGADANEHQRLSYYYQVMSQSQRQALDTFREQVSELEELESVQQRSVDRVETQQNYSRQQLFRLRQSQQNREETLTRLRQTLSRSSDQVEQLEVERAQMERVVRELTRAINSLSAPNRTPFQQLRGELPKPSDGRLINRFGDRRNGHIKWRGHRYIAPVGEPVRAVAYGRVVYANWLSGQGLLIAVDHGDSYLTLYANNQSLLKSVGEWVEAGETIATVGNSGGLDDAALYFEIRHNGQPVNPRQWIK